ncbi:SbtR family transcriptional regulator [Streptomyces mirabilis]|uniref:SbtR family transcriptional regulator n=1 Tax=Streptomyces mirabilis TaxID=68239 RepID=UPI0033313E12
MGTPQERGIGLGDAPREWMARLASLRVAKQHMSEALRSVGPFNGARASESYAQFCDTIDTFVAAGVAAGTIRSDLETAEVMLAMSGLLRLDVTGDWKGQADRQIKLLMDGLQAGTRPHPLNVGTAEGTPVRPRRDPGDLSARFSAPLWPANGDRGRRVGLYDGFDLIQAFAPEVVYPLDWPYPGRLSRRPDVLPDRTHPDTGQRLVGQL